MTICRATMLMALTIIFFETQCSAIYSQITTSWTAAGVNTNFHNITNWDNGIPGISDEAVFGVAGPFIVTMDSQAAIKEFTHEIGTMTLTGGKGLTVGLTPDLNNFLIVVNPDTRFDSQTDLNVGNVELASLTLLNGAESDTAGIVLVGQNPGVQGTLTVNGVGTTFSSNDLRIGQLGTGILTVMNSGQVSSFFGRVGNQPGSAGMATVSGNGSEWNNGQFVAVGANGGTGVLDVVNGGRVSSDVNAFIGTIETATGTINVTGTVSEFSVGNNLDVGNDGVGTLNVTSAGQVSTSLLRLGRRSTATGNVNISNSGSVDATTLVVGREGDGVLDIFDGGNVTCNSAIFGQMEFGTAEVTVADAGSALFCNFLQIGADGIADVHIENGGGISAGTSSSINADSQLVFQDLNMNYAGVLATSVPMIVDGQVTFLSGFGDIEGGVDLVNDGEIQVGSSAIGNIFGDVSSNGFRIFVSPVGELNFFGDFTGDAPFVGSGTVNFLANVRPGDTVGAVSLDGDVSLQSTASLEIQLGGTNPGISYDQLVVDGNLALGGNIDVMSTGGFQPVLGQEFTIISVGGNRTGAFQGVSQGDVVGAIGMVDLEINYFGGDGNDVVLLAIEQDVLLGDINLDGNVDLLDVAPFVALISSGAYQAEADINQDGSVDLLDVSPFVAILSGS